jgi:hypothetical protein
VRQRGRFRALAVSVGLLCLALVLLPAPLGTAQTPTASPTLFSTPLPTATPTATPQPVADGLQLEIGYSVNGSITQPRQRDRVIVVGRAGAVISLGMFPLPTSRLVPRIEVYAPNGEVVVSVTHPTGAVISGYQLPVTGAYIVFASADGNRTRGEYSLSAAAGLAVRDLPRGDLSFDAPITGELLRAGDRDVYEIEQAGNMTLTVEAAPYQSRLVPVLEVVDLKGNVLARAAGITGGRVILTPFIAVPGRVRVQISGLEGRTTGRYLLLVRSNGR